MRRMALAASLLVPLSTGCTTNPLVCANNLDGSALGFRMIIPVQFVCSSLPLSPLSFLKGSAFFTDDANGLDLAVFVISGSSSAADDPADLEGEGTDLGAYTSANGIVFALSMVVRDNGQTTYGGVTELPSGDALVVLLGADAENDLLIDTLKSILDTVELTP